MSNQMLIENRELIESTFKGVGGVLAESKWSDWCNDPEFPIENDEVRASLATVLENYDRFVNNMSETTRAQHIGDFQKYAFPLIRAIFPELAANFLVSVQPMLGPTSTIFYLEFLYGSSKGGVRRGDPMFSAIGRGPGNADYSSSQVRAEQIGTSTIASSVTLGYSPVVPGTVMITDGAQIITDDGQGNLVGDVTAGGTINYANGTLTSAAFATPPASGTVITSDYLYDMEANTKEMIPQVDMLLQQVPVVARPRKLRAEWSLEAGFDLRSLHGLDAEGELVAATGSEIRFEIDREIITDLKRFAGAGSVFWNKDLPTGVSYAEHKLSFVDSIVTASNLIHEATGRAGATWIVCGTNVASVIETIPGFVRTGGAPTGLMKGVVRTGNLMGQWDVFKDPYYDKNSYMVGFKGGSFLEAGYVYAPYIPLYTTPTMVFDDFKGRKGIATRYGKKSINPLFYVTGELGGGVALATKAGVSTTSLTDPNGKAIVTHGSATDLGLAIGKGVFGL